MTIQPTENPVSPTDVMIGFTILSNGRKAYLVFGDGTANAADVSWTRRRGDKVDVRFRDGSVETFKVHPDLLGEPAPASPESAPTAGRVDWETEYGLPSPAVQDAGRGDLGSRSAAADLASAAGAFEGSGGGAGAGSADDGI